MRCGVVLVVIYLVNTGNEKRKFAMKAGRGCEYSSPRSAGYGMDTLRQSTDIGRRYAGYRNATILRSVYRMLVMERLALQVGARVIEDILTSFANLSICTGVKPVYANMPICKAISEISVYKIIV